jgi:hypothetical protein
MPVKKSKSAPLSSVSDDVLQKKIREAVQDLFKDPNFGSTLLTSLGDLIGNAIAVEMKEKIRELSDECSTLKKELAMCREEIVVLKNNSALKIDDQEQHARRSNLRIFGITEVHNEDTTVEVIRFAKRLLNVEIRKEDVDRSRRLGEKKNDVSTTPRPILVNFTNFWARRAIFSQKKKLKGTGVTVREDLTKTRHEILKTARSMYGIRNTWTTDGKVMFVRDGRTCSAVRLSDLTSSN